MSAAEKLIANGFTASVHRTDRKKTVTIKVENGVVSIVAPHHLPPTRIKEVVARKDRWIKEKLRIHGSYPPVKNKEYISGESFSYLGRNYRLKLVAGKKKPVKLIAGRLVVTIPVKDRTDKVIRGLLEEWYISHANRTLLRKCERLAKQIGVEPKSVTVKEFKSRWGSCTLAGNIYLNWKIVMAPSGIVDYVVAHELCHLKHHDHSPKYWSTLQNIVPNYLACREWLKVHGRGLEL